MVGLDAVIFVVSTFACFNLPMLWFLELSLFSVLLLAVSNCLQLADRSGNQPKQKDETFALFFARLKGASLNR